MGCSSSRSSSSQATMSPAPTTLKRVGSDLGDHDMYEVYSQYSNTTTQQKRRGESSNNDNISHVPESSSVKSVPFWVIKTRNSEQHKVFINVCGTKAVGKTSNFSKPVMKILPPLKDIDKKNDDAFTYDVFLSLEDCEFLSKTHGEYGDLDGFWTDINRAIVTRVNEKCGDELNCESLSYPLLINKYKGSQVRSPYEGNSSNSNQRRNSLSRARQIEKAEAIEDINLHSPLPPPPPPSLYLYSTPTKINDNVNTKKLPVASPTPRRATGQHTSRTSMQRCQYRSHCS